MHLQECFVAFRFFFLPLQKHIQDVHFQNVIIYNDLVCWSDTSSESEICRTILCIVCSVLKSIISCRFFFFLKDNFLLVKFFKILKFWKFRMFISLILLLETLVNVRFLCDLVIVNIVSQLNHPSIMLYKN